MKDILIVEDGVKERERLHKLFSAAGYSTIACASVGEAESALNVDAFRLAILDIGLSDKSGSHLFNTIKRGGRVSFIVIFTGNPSVHLKGRFIDEGAVDYIVKGSTQAQNDSFMQRVKELIGEASKHSESFSGIDLETFLQTYVQEKSRALFQDSDGSLPACKDCNSRRYTVTFAHKAQVPPEISGRVICSGCGKLLDLSVG